MCYLNFLSLPYSLGVFSFLITPPPTTLEIYIFLILSMLLYLNIFAYKINITLKYVQTYLVFKII